MIRILAATAAGLLVGAVAAHLLTRASLSPDGPVVRDIAGVPKISAVAAEQHRSAHYADIATIEDALALPTEFAQMEALFVLAGRSDAAVVQTLIFAANRIADDFMREQALVILFHRLAELDAASALALARTEYFSDLRSIEDTVWRARARQNLDDALLAAKSQATDRDRERAAQSLFAAFGYMSNDVTDRIEAELDIAPDRSTRARYLYRLADQSPEEAIRYVEKLDEQQRIEAASWLAHHLAQSDPALAASVASRFDDARLELTFRSVVQNNAARRQPRAVLDDILASGRIGDRISEFSSAIQALASEDVDAALAYYQQLETAEMRRQAGAVIVERLAEEDPRQALLWARENESPGNYPRLEMSALLKIARTDPQLAIDEALRSPNRRHRMNHISNIISRVAEDDPRAAVVMAERIADRQLQTQARQSAVSRWMHNDAEAAVDWMLSQDDADELLSTASWMLVNSDVDAAIRVLDRVPVMQQRNLQTQIARQLAASRSPAEAQEFIKRFEGEPNHPQLQATVISAMAESDPALARQMADQLSDRTARNAAYAAVIGQQAQRDPRAAVGMLSLIDDDRYRGAVSGQIASQWYASEPDAAMRWVSALPAGGQRDDAVMHMASEWDRPTRAQQALIDGIEDESKRGQAKLLLVYNLVQTDPEQARALLADPDIPEHQRRQLELTLRDLGLGF